MGRDAPARCPTRARLPISLHQNVLRLGPDLGQKWRPNRSPNWCPNWCPNCCPKCCPNCCSNLIVVKQKENSCFTQVNVGQQFGQHFGQQFGHGFGHQFGQQFRHQFGQHFGHQFGHSIVREWVFATLRLLLGAPSRDIEALASSRSKTLLRTS